MNNLAAANQKAKSQAQERLLRALEEPSLDAAMAAYNRRPETFWKQCTKMGLMDRVRELYPDDMAAKDKAMREAREEGWAHARAVQIEMEEQRRADVTEDAEWLAQTGETQEGAARRLGFKTWDSLYKRLTDWDRSDITDRLTRNTEPAGKTRQGSIFTATHGARLS